MICKVWNSTYFDSPKRILLYSRSNIVTVSYTHLNRLQYRFVMPSKHLDIEFLQILNQHRRVRANHLINLLSILVEQKRRHGADAQLLAQLWQLIHVKLDKVDLVLELCLFRGSVFVYLSLAT